MVSGTRVIHGKSPRSCSVFAVYSALSATINERQHLPQLTQMRVQRLPETGFITAVAAQGVHPQRYARLMFANQLQYHLIEVWSMVATIALSDVNNAFRHVLLVAVVDTST